MSGKKLLKEGLSCSKKLSIPSRDCTQIKSLLNVFPKGPTRKFVADRSRPCS